VPDPTTSSGGGGAGEGKAGKKPEADEESKRDG